jgi:hypothetical protein
MAGTFEQAHWPAPKRKARWAGGMWLLVILCGLFAEVGVRGTLVVRGDAAASAALILANEQYFRLGIGTDLAGAGFYVAATFLVYELMKPVNRSIALFSTLLGLAGSIVMIANLANMVDVLLYLKGGDVLAPFTAGQRQALAYMAIRLHSTGYNIAMIAFAGQVLLLGLVVARAGFVPRLLGWLFVIEGLGGFVRGIGVILFAAFPDALNEDLLLPGLVAEGGFALWLLVMGVDVAKWRQAANARVTDMEKT